MRCLTVALCVASLSLSGAGLARGKVAKLASKVREATPIGKIKHGRPIGKIKQWGATLALGALALAGTCLVTGCDQGRQMADSMVGAKATKDNPVKFGVIYEHEFQQSFDGVELAAMEVNRAGGINGRYVELIPQKIYVRNKSDAVSAAENLIVHDEVLAILGANYSTISEFVDEVVAIYGVPMITIGSTSATLTRASENIFLAAFPDSFQGYVMAKLAVEDTGADRAAVIFWGQDAYSKGLAESFRDSFTELGGSVVAYHGYTYETTQENEFFATALNEAGIVASVMMAQPDVVFIPGFSESAVVAMELRAAGEDAVFLGADGWGVQDFKVGGEAVEGAYFSDHFTAESSPQFSENYRQAYGIEADGLAALGYDALRVAAQAAQRAGSELTRETLRDEIQATENYLGATNIVRYDESRHPVKSAVIFRIENGQKMFFKLVNP